MKVFIVVIVYAFFCLAGCKKDGAPQSSSGDSGVSPATRTSNESSSPAVDACTVVSAEDLTRILGEPVSGRKPDTPTPSAGQVTVTHCIFTASNGIKSAGILIRDSAVGDNNPGYVKKTMEDNGMKMEDVAGIGDSAFYSGNQLIVYKGKHIQLVVSMFGFDNPKERSIEIARSAMTKL